MTRLEFLSTLEKKISALPEKDIRRTVDYYDEMLEDYSEDGLDTDEAIEKMGGIDRIVSDILTEARGQSIEENEEKLNTGATSGIFSVLRIALISAVSLGIFVSLLLSAALATATVVTLIDGVVSLFSSSPVLAIFTLGAALVFGAVSIIFGILGIYLIKYLKKSITKSNDETKGEKQNDNS